MKFLRDKSGFLTIDVILLSTILIVIAFIWSILGYLNHMQILASQRANAIFLAQGYLNKVENQIMTDKKLNLSEHEKIVLNDITFYVDGKITVGANDIYAVKVNVNWQYDGINQNEQQERELVKI